MDTDGNPAPERPESGNHPDREHDTIAQRPTRIGDGASKSPPQSDAHLANQNRTPGAQPPEEIERAPIT